MSTHLGIIEFHSREKEVFEVGISNDAVFLVWMPENQSTAPSVGFLIPQKAFKHADDMVPWVARTLTKEADSRVFRLFGDHQAIARLEGILKSAGLRAGLSIPFVERSTRLQFLPGVSRVRVEKHVDAAPVKPVKKAKTRVLVVDDSETIRKLLSRIFSEDDSLECVGTVENPKDAFKAIDELKPDVITLDIHMPGMDGVTLLKRILPKYRLPCVMISSLSKDDGDFVLDALEAGAVEYIQKPSMSELKTVAPLICEKVKAAALSRVVLGKKNLDAVKVNSAEIDLSYLILIGSSTGGTEALREVLTRLPASIPPILIVQHIPPVFSKAFADRMNTLCQFEVREAADGDLVSPNQVLIAPGGKQMKVIERKGELRILIDDSPPVNRHKPSVDALFDSVLELKRRKLVAGILTGMGADGAKGLLKLKNDGALTFAQDEATSVVYGMPKEAAKIGAVQTVLPIDEIPKHVLGLVMKNQKKAA